MTLTSFPRSHDGLDGWKMACPHPVSWMNGWIFTKPVRLYCWDMEKNWLDFGDLDPIFKVTGGLRLLENGLSTPYLQNEWKDFDQTCTSTLYIVVTRKKTHFQGHTMDYIVEKWLICTISWRNGWILTKVGKMAFLHTISRMNGWILT